MTVKRIIDFHTHIFPDNLAERAIKALEERAKSKPFTNGTLSDTLKVLNEWNTDYAVSLNIAVLPKSVAKVNDFAINTNGGKIISFGSVHPYADNSISELERIKNAGLKGIKLHPEYQEFDVEIDRAIEIYRKCGELNLIVLLHCGTDIAYPDTLRASPLALLTACKSAPDTKFVLAHMGGHQCWDGVLEHLAGLYNVWFDTSYMARTLDIVRFKKIVDKHGVKRILYATDCPWESGIETQKYIYNMGYTNQEVNDIMYNNAVELLGGLNG